MTDNCYKSYFRAWLYDGPGIVEKTTHRVGLLTGLATKSSPRFSNTEAYQIVNYGIGGMYHPHHDAFVSWIEYNSSINVMLSIYLNWFSRNLLRARIWCNV